MMYLNDLITNESMEDELPFLELTSDYRKVERLYISTASM